jgi:hypothetical protein
MDDNSIMDLASEFFYEFRRFIPGLAVLAFYLDEEAKTALSNYPGWSVAGILIIAWLLGLVIESVMSAVVHCLYMWVGWLDERKIIHGLTKRLLKVVKAFDIRVDELGNPDETEKTKTLIARAKSLQFAERQVSRSLCLVFLIVAVFPPRTFLGFPWPQSFGWYGMVAFGFSWVWPYVMRAWDRKPGDRWVIKGS